MTTKSVVYKGNPMKLLGPIKAPPSPCDGTEKRVRASAPVHALALTLET
jgi:hypothetical protein